MIDETIKQWATKAEIEAIDTVNECGSGRAAAKSLGIGETTLRDRITRAKARAAAQGYSPEHGMTKAIPRPFIAKGHSTYYNREGVAVGQWVKSTIDQEAWYEILKETAANFASEIQPLPPRPSSYVSDTWASKLCNQYTFTDVHVGMLAWHEEGGQNWDLKIAENSVMKCFELMMELSPKAERAIIAQLGDLLHSDSLVPVTPSSNHVLDQDGRYAKIVRAAIRIIRRMVDRALEKHQVVDLLLAEGNHDMSGSVWLRELFAALYENEPRVTVITSPLPYYAIQHGNTALFFHHGHKKKLAQLPQLFAAQFPAIWGATEHRYAHTGHLHHVHEKEEHGIQIYQHPTIAARDAYASRGGWFSTRRATALFYHSDFGEAGRLHITPDMAASK